MVNPDGARPAKRRRLTTKRDRTTRYINLVEGFDNSEQEELSPSILDLQDVLRHKKKIVVIAGAGISVSSGSTCTPDLSPNFALPADHPYSPRLPLLARTLRQPQEPAQAQGIRRAAL